MQINVLQAQYIHIAQKIAALDTEAAQKESISALPVVIAATLQEAGIKKSDEVVSFIFHLISPEDLKDFQMLNPYPSEEPIKTALPILDDMAGVEALIKPRLLKQFRTLKIFEGSEFSDEDILQTVKTHIKDVMAEQIRFVLTVIPKEHDFWKEGGFQNILNMTMEQLVEDVMNERGFAFDDEILETFDPQEP